MTSSVPFAIDALSTQVARLATPGIDPKDELGIRLSVFRVRCVMAEMVSEAYANDDNWKRLGELVEAILKPISGPDAE